eukprot:CAMPEP_0116098502 /NCGR_PEP_ID=MMETSP0327-20121206/11258_1 /TAXON_ID=44447 /ORGANISM="Pseudo-nitzschia delicatissima, Strain B596" /LENGTH=35 /DNA_ID= /DNA_START= /DNA_END= /DNA_ORIENTATION=
MGGQGSGRINVILLPLVLPGVRAGDAIRSTSSPVD